MERATGLADRVPLQHSAPLEPVRGRSISISSFYINRDCDEGRRIAIENGLRDVGINAERVSAVDGLEVPANLEDYFFVSKKQVSQLNAGEIGCYASHLKVASIIVDRVLPSALVLEDDAILPKNFAEHLKNILATLPEGWDIVHLSGDNSRAVKPIGRLDGSHILVRYSRVPAGTVAYLISQAGAKKFLVPLKRYWPVDTDMRQPWRFKFQIYGVVPKIVGHCDELPSAIISKGERSRLRRGLPRPIRGSWTGNPLHTPHGFFYNLKILGPTWWLRCYVRNSVRRLSGILGF